MRRTYRYEEMVPQEFLAEVERMPVFIVSTGLLEWHGDHLPLGQDTLKAYGICGRVCEKLGGGILLPPHYWGRPGFSTFVGTLTFSEQAMFGLFTEVFTQLVKVGGRVILLVTGHYGGCQVDFVKTVASEFQAGHPDVRVIAQPEYEGVTVDGERPADHAGKFETSMFWHLYPHLTRIEAFRPGPYTVHQYEDPPENVYHESPNREWQEDLREVASPELGEKCVEAISDHLVDVVTAALKDLGLG